jgi:hypothetical protein
MTDYSVILASLKAGDRVWIGRSQYGRWAGKICEVVKVTRTQAVVKITPTYECRFKLDGGFQIGAGMFADQILDRATSQECKAWDEKQQREKQEAERKQAEKEATERKRSELGALFGGDATYVHEEQYGSEAERIGKWTVEFHNLTEEQVRNLATADVVWGAS